MFNRLFRGATPADSSNHPPRHIPTNPFDLPPSPTRGTPTYTDAMAAERDWPHAGAIPNISHESRRHSASSFEVVDPLDVQSSHSSMSLMSYDGSDDAPAVVRTGASPPLPIPHPEQDEAYLAQHMAPVAAGHTSSLMARLLGSSGPTTISAPPFPVPVRSGTPDSTVADSILTDQLLPTLQTGAILHTTQSPPAPASPVLAATAPTVTEVASAAPPADNGHRSYLGWLRPHEPTLVPGPTVVSGSPPSAASVPTPIVSPTGTSAPTTAIPDVVTAIPAVATAVAESEDGWELDGPASPATIATAASAPPPIAPPPVAPVAVRGSSMAAGLRRRLGLARVKSVPLLPAARVPESDSEDLEVAALKEERDELAEKLLNTDAALSEEQLKRRNAVAEANHQRAIVNQLLAGQMDLSTTPPDTLPTTPRTGEIPSTPTGAAAATAAGTFANGAEDDDIPERDELALGSVCGVDCLVSLLILAVGRLVRNVVTAGGRFVSHTTKAYRTMVKRITQATDYELWLAGMVVIATSFLVLLLVVFSGSLGAVARTKASAGVKVAANADSASSALADPASSLPAATQLPAQLGGIGLAPPSPPGSPPPATTLANTADQHASAPPAISISGIPPPGPATPVAAAAPVAAPSPAAANPLGCRSTPPHTNQTRSVDSASAPSAASAPRIIPVLARRPGMAHSPVPATAPAAQPGVSEAPKTSAKDMESQLRLQHVMLKARENMLMSQLNVVRALLQDLEGASQRAGLSLTQSSPSPQATTTSADAPPPATTAEAAAPAEPSTPVAATSNPAIQAPCPRRPLASLPCAVPRPSGLWAPMTEPFTAHTFAAAANMVSSADFNASTPGQGPEVNIAVVQQSLGWSAAPLALPPRCATPSYQQFCDMVTSARTTAKLLSGLSSARSLQASSTPAALAAIAIAALPTAIPMPPMLPSPGVARNGCRCKGINGTSKAVSQGMVARSSHVMRELALSVSSVMQSTARASQALLSMYARNSNLTLEACTEDSGMPQAAAEPAGKHTSSNSSNATGRHRLSWTAGWGTWPRDRRPCNIFLLRRAASRLARLRAARHRNISNVSTTPAATPQAPSTRGGCGKPVTISNTTVPSQQILAAARWWHRLTKGSATSNLTLPLPGVAPTATSGQGAPTLLNLWRVLSSSGAKGCLRNNTKARAAETQRARQAAARTVQALLSAPVRKALAPAVRKARYYAPAGLAWFMLKATKCGPACHMTNTTHGKSSIASAPVNASVERQPAAANQARAANSTVHAGLALPALPPMQAPQAAHTANRTSVHAGTSQPKAPSPMPAWDASLPAALASSPPSEIRRTVSALSNAVHVSQKRLLHMGAHAAQCSKLLGRRSSICEEIGRRLGQPLASDKRLPSLVEVEGTLQRQAERMWEEVAQAKKLVEHSETQQAAVHKATEQLKKAVRRALAHEVSPCTTPTRGTSDATCSESACKRITFPMQRPQPCSCVCSKHARRAWKAVAARMKIVHKHLLRSGATADHAMRACDSALTRVETAQAANTALARAMTWWHVQEVCSQPGPRNKPGCFLIESLRRPDMAHELANMRTGLQRALKLMDAWSASVQDAVPWVVKMRRSL